MNLKQQLDALVKGMQDIVNTAQKENRELTLEESTDIEAKAAEAETLKAQIIASQKALKSTSDLVKHLSSSKSTPEDESDLDDDTEDAEQKASTVSERFIKSAAFGKFQKDFPTGLGAGSQLRIDRVRVGSEKDYFAMRKSGGQKALITSPIARLAPVRYPTLDLINHPKLTLLDLIGHGSIGTNALEYVQIVSVTRNAAIVPEATSSTDNAALKPTSDLATAIADAKVYTYADGFDVTNQLLSDAPAFASFMESELEYSIDAKITDMLLNGTGTSGQPRGILNTTGILEREYTESTGSVMPLVKAIRRAITDINLLEGGNVQAILMNPEDDAEIDLMQDGNDRFYGQGPFGVGPNTLWGRPRVVDESIEPGTVLLGDFSTVQLLDREGLSVQAFNQHKDYAQRNLVYVRAELRAAQVIWRPSRLCVVTPDA